MYRPVFEFQEDLVLTTICVGDSVIRSTGRRQ